MVAAIGSTLGGDLGRVYSDQRVGSSEGSHHDGIREEHKPPGTRSHQRIADGGPNIPPNALPGTKTHRGSG